MTSALDRNIPRTCTPVNATLATNGDNQEGEVTYVADLAIDPKTEKVDFSHAVPIDSYLANPEGVREAMQQLLDIIIRFFEVETQKVENGVLKEEDQLFEPYVQEHNTDTKHPARLPPKNPYQRRAEDTTSDHQAN